MGCCYSHHKSAKHPSRKKKTSVPQTPANKGEVGLVGAPCWHQFRTVVFTTEHRETLQEKMECQPAGENGASCGNILRTISDPGHPSKREREEREATRAEYRSVCVACVRGRGIAMKHQTSAVGRSDEGRLHTFVKDNCLSVTRQSARDHSAGHQRDQDDSEQHVHGYT